MKEEFAREYGRGARQENVRSKTKELTGTLPYAISTRPTEITVQSQDDVVAQVQEREIRPVTRSAAW